MAKVFHGKFNHFPNFFSGNFFYQGGPVFFFSHNLKKKFLILKIFYFLNVAKFSYCNSLGEKTFFGTRGPNFPQTKGFSVFFGEWGGRAFFEGGGGAQKPFLSINNFFSEKSSKRRGEVFVFGEAFS